MNDNSPAIPAVRFGLVAAIAVGALICSGSGPAATSVSSTNLALPIKLPDPLPFPSVAATPAELARLRAAWETTGPAHEAVARRVAEADDGLKRTVLFPPEGGHHNQWY